MLIRQTVRLREVKNSQRDALHLQIEELQEQRENLTHEVNTAHHRLQICYDNMDEARDRILQLRDELNNVYARYLHHNVERLGRQARALAPYQRKRWRRFMRVLEMIEIRGFNFFSSLLS